LCCSGPFSAYRRSVLELVLDDYLNQTFRRRPTTHGEDRHLTNLVLGAGNRTAYVAGAVAATVVPERLRPFLRQQLRWNRSVYRDMFTFATRLPALGWYPLLDAFVQIFAPALLGLTVVLLVLYSLLVGTSGLAFYGAGLIVVALAYCAYGVVRTRDVGFFGLALYGLLHIVVLIPVRIRALFTLTDDRWGQRSAGSRHDRFGPDLPQERSPSAMSARQRTDRAETDHAQA
jgi:cellulose synthase/poly-beta-1,6-N-acetylglucosamine synthase-like glycosyltransferase